MNNRDKRSIFFFALWLAVAGAGVAAGSGFLTFAGLFAIAITLRYRKKPRAWEYLCFLVLVLALAAVAWSVSTGAKSSPLLGAIPWMLSYVLDYLDERRQKRAVAANVTEAAGASHTGRLGESSAPPNGGPPLAWKSRESLKGRHRRAESFGASKV